VSRLPLHVFVIASSNYHDLVPYCIQSIERFIQHPFLTKNIVSNSVINIDGWRCILDHDFWSRLDPQKKNSNIYRLGHVRQQIFKLSLDIYEQGTFLVVDPEVLFLRPTQMDQQNQTVLYALSTKSSEPHFNFTRYLCGLESQKNFGFITDQMTYSSDILRKIRARIEQEHRQDWISVFQSFLRPDNVIDSFYAVSEFELIANFLLEQNPNLPLRHIDKYLIQMIDRQQHPFDELISMLQSRFDQDFISVNTDIQSYSTNTDNPWLTFYYSIKDPSWPDCWQEKDFASLPLHVQNECQNVFQYQIFRPDLRKE
jgi:hypothetical protein